MRQIIQTDLAPAPVGPYNQAVSHNGTLYVSGQIAIDPTTGELVNESIEAETRQVMNNVAAILKEAGVGFDHVLKCSVFVGDMSNYGRINAAYSEFFNDAIAPARELVEVARLPNDANIEISVIAAL